jgi:hypothetical protein
MSNAPLPEGSVVLRLEFSIADAVQQRGLLSVLGTAIAAWWNRPRLPQNLPNHLRADIGLPLDYGPLLWYSVPSVSAVPSLDRRRRQ